MQYQQVGVVHMPLQQHTHLHAEVLDVGSNSLIKRLLHHNDIW